MYIKKETKRHYKNIYHCSGINISVSANRDSGCLLIQRVKDGNCMDSLLL